MTPDKHIFHAAASRGHANHGWLDAHHTFSFADYYDPNRIQFGALRVLNDDTIAGGMGFDTHPHRDMEIITIPLEGAIAHRDSMGHDSVIRAGDIQVMSAGIGIRHSEFNADATHAVNLLQIWILPDKSGHQPRYAQASFTRESQKNRLLQVVGPESEGKLWVNQQCWFSKGIFDHDFSLNYQAKSPSNGCYFFVISGEFIIAKKHLSSRDGYGVADNEIIQITAVSQDSELLVIDVPL